MIGLEMMGPITGFGGFMSIGMLLVWVVIGLGIYLLVSSFYRPRRSEYRRALAIARERYVRGEITLDEYEKIRRNL